MFKFKRGLDVITLFHRPAVPASVRANTLLKQLAAHAQETATEDQAADHTAQNEMQRVPFELNVTESVPTSDQFKTIMEYVGAQRASQLVAGARDETDALQRLKQDPTSFTPPLTVDWNNGRAVVGEDATALKKLIAQLPADENI